MNQFIYQLIKRKEYLEDLKIKIMQKLQNVPEGNLRVSNDRGIPRYYHVTEPGDTHGKYTSKKNQELACQLAQRDYSQICILKTNTREFIWAKLNYYI